MTVIDKILKTESPDVEAMLSDGICEWHETRKSIMPLYEHLGMTRKEYKKWVIDPHYITEILSHRRDASRQT